MFSKRYHVFGKVIYHWFGKGQHELADAATGTECVLLTSHFLCCVFI